MIWSKRKTDAGNEVFVHDDTVRLHAEWHQMSLKCEAESIAWHMVYIGLNDVKSGRQVLISNSCSWILATGKNWELQCYQYNLKNFVPGSNHTLAAIGTKKEDTRLWASSGPHEFPYNPAEATKSLVRTQQLRWLIRFPLLLLFDYGYWQK